MKRYRRVALEAEAARRKPGFLAAIFDAAFVDGDFLELPDEDLDRIAAEYSLVPLPATAQLPRPPCGPCRGL